MNGAVTLRVALALGMTASLLAACGGGGSAAPSVPGVQKYQISGTITGLSPGASAVLQDNGADNLTVSPRTASPSRRIPFTKPARYPTAAARRPPM